MKPLEPPEVGPSAAIKFVAEHLSQLVSDESSSSPSTFHSS